MFHQTDAHSRPMRPNVDGSGTAVPERTMSSSRTEDSVDVFVNLNDRVPDVGMLLGLMGICRQAVVPPPVGCGGNVGVKLKKFTLSVLKSIRRCVRLDAVANLEAPNES